MGMLIDEYQVTWNNMIKSQSAEVILLRERAEQLEKQKNMAEDMVRQLQNDIQGLKDENKSFMSVSTIVSMTNENAKLKQQLALIQKSLYKRNTPPNNVSNEQPVSSVSSVQEASTLSTVVDQESSHEAPTLSTVVDQESTPRNVEEDEEVEYFEKKIKGVLYYIDDQDNIYAIEDGEVGAKVGHYVTKNDKKKVKWISSDA
jgi:hypothetical protein